MNTHSAKFGINNNGQSMYHMKHPESDCVILYGKCTIGAHWIVVGGEFPVFSMLLVTIGFVCGALLVWLITSL